MPLPANALTQAELDDKCVDGDAVRLHPLCHPEAGLSVVYDRDSGVLHVSCKTCDQLLVTIEVAL